MFHYAHRVAKRNAVCLFVAAANLMVYGFQAGRKKTS